MRSAAKKSAGALYAGRCSPRPPRSPTPHSSLADTCLCPSTSPPAPLGLTAELPTHPPLGAQTVVRTVFPRCSAHAQPSECACACSRRRACARLLVASPVRAGTRQVRVPSAQCPPTEERAGASLVPIGCPAGGGLENHLRSQWGYPRHRGSAGRWRESCPSGGGTDVVPSQIGSV